MVRFRIIFQGRVQGVGFRWFVARTARMYGLTGYVRNLDDGRVESEVQGVESEVMAFLKRVRQGNGYSSVVSTDLRTLDLCPQEYEFVIEPD